MIDVTLPATWSSKRLKYLATYNDEVLPESTDEEAEIDYVEISGVSLSRGVEQVERISFGQAPSRARRKVRSGDILISTVRTYLRAIAKVDEASPDLIASTGFCVVRPDREEVDSGYLGWAAKSEPFVSEVVSRSVGVSYPAINASELVTIEMPLPPLETQRRIAQFLDEKTARIDGLIEKKRALLDRLAEKRQALITRAVTKGLNPDAPMKPSGIDWLGDIPVHWEVLPLRRITANVATGRTPPSTLDYFSNGELNWFTPGDFAKGIELDGSARRIIPEAIEDGVCTLFPENTVFLVGIGATLGKVAVSTAPGSANQQINAIIPDHNSDSCFIAYFLHGFRTEVRVTSNGNTLGILNQSGTKSLLIPVPPLSEQNNISNELKNYDEREINTIRQIEDSIKLLNQYRSALITSAVTGQIGGLQ